ncbi:Ger(x)C family spore germination protein [Paenibacillus cymbidii]|uniref:Ger(x)C family spore germination protein n=1 Tax=Paenibacillus cymbidii TaxID=1639034 RepID=UPI001F40E251|nr:Ger(x)C family spore germination protein [Paenibacillus cymbidii]
MNKKRMAIWIRLLATLLAIVPLTSCIGQWQINDLALVTAVGLDVGQKPGTVLLSAQIIRPADARGQTGAPSGGTGEPIYSISAEGKTIFEAIRNLGRISSRRVYWAHNFLIVMNESYARRGIGDMIDFFTRNHELRMNTWVAVTPDSPDQLISTITGLEIVPGEAINRLFRNNHIVGVAPRTNMMVLEESYLTQATHPVLAKLKLVRRGISNKKPEEHGSIEQVELAGAAAFAEDRMAGWLTIKETRGLLFFLEQLDNGIEVVPCPNEKTGQATLEFRHAKLHVDPAYRNGKASFRIRLATEADIVENGCQATEADIRQGTEAELTQELESAITSVLVKAQREYKSDFLKLGDVFRNEYPLEWRTLKQSWDDVFAAAETTVEVKATIKSGVLKAAGMGVK